MRFKKWIGGLQRRKQKGMSLIEIAVLLVFVSLTMIPIIRTIGSNTHSAPGDNRTFTAISRQQSHTLVAANSIMESALAGDINVLATNTLTPGQVLVTSRQQYTSDYGRQVWYDWSLRDTSYKTDAAGNPLQYNAAGNVVGSGSPLASGASYKLAVANGNQLVQATLRVYSQANGGTPILQLPTVLFRNNNGANFPATKVGIMIVQDVSGSMQQGKAAQYGNPVDASTVTDDITHITYPNPSIDPNHLVASPYLYYRFEGQAKASPVGYPSAQLNLWDNTQLDLVGGAYSPYVAPPGYSPDPVPATTFFQENYPQRNTKNLFPDIPCGVTGNWISYVPTNPLTSYFMPWPFVNNAARAAAQATCGNKLNDDDATHANTGKIDVYLSRIEASRSALFNFLINTETNPSLVTQIKMGLLTFSSSNNGRPAVENQVALENSQLYQGATHYVNMRKKLAWINRGDTINTSGNGNTIFVGGGTLIYDGLLEATNQLYADTSLTQRIIFLVTDGAPSPNTGYNNTSAGLAAFCNQIGNGRSFPGAPLDSTGQKAQITLFSIGLINADQASMANWSAQTPGGVSLFAQSASDLSALFEEIAYQIQKTIYLNASSRYNF